MSAPPDNNPNTQYGLQKPSLGFIPPAALLHESVAMADGAKKYGPYNWREKQVSVMVYVHAAMRHITQYLDREDFDPVSRAHHLAHARACFGILLDALETGNLIDDRPLAGAAGDLIRRFTNVGTLDPRALPSLLEKPEDSKGSK